MQRWQGDLKKTDQGAIALKEIGDQHFSGQTVYYLPQLGQRVDDSLQHRVERS
ncbi:tsr0934 [Thermosynechococcus vestitus BP-1]|uniref:Tsr0934 protein n=1 Tax=Thermosynechococcus vestitus (strain NIES-2133 / IAM M-273 / BP-1) TaxID=197221 RepID=Q8DKC5_THEVB|nr:tsr0934 [Thermosynechococcus vestitus BP-1]